MKSNILKLTLLVPVIFGSVNVMAAGSSQHSAQASTHSSEAIAHSSIAGVKLASGVAAVPLIIVGEVGNVSGQTGNELWNNVNRPIGKPLEITDEIITSVASPEQAMKAEGE